MGIKSLAARHKKPVYVHDIICRRAGDAEDVSRALAGAHAWPAVANTKPVVLAVFKGHRDMRAELMRYLERFEPEITVTRRYEDG